MPDKITIIDAGYFRPEKKKVDPSENNYQLACQPDRLFIIECSSETDLENCGDPLIDENKKDLKYYILKDRDGVLSVSADGIKKVTRVD